MRNLIKPGLGRTLRDELWHLRVTLTLLIVWSVCAGILIAGRVAGW